MLTAACAAVLLAYPQSPGGFDGAFDPAATLRIDTVHSGTAETEAIAIAELRTEGPWPGRADRAAVDLGLGKYRFRAFDAESGSLLFTTGYSTLFAEWQTTDPARAGEVRAFHETLRMPRPRRPVRVEFESRGRDGVLRPLFTAIVDPDSWEVRPTEPVRGAQLLTLVESGPPAECVDLLIAGVGYADDEAEEFAEDAQRMADTLLSFEPFRSRKDDFNVRAVRPPGDETGVDEPRKGVFVRTLVGASFNALNLERYLLVDDTRTLRDLGAMAPYDTLIVMVNSPRYGGGGILGEYAAVAADHPRAGHVVVHEFGHSFAGLGDEYFSSEVAYNEFYPAGVEPWEPNLAAFGVRDRLKWLDLVAPDTPIPTPATPQYADVVGAFEGAGYAAKGMFRPQLSCVMKDGGAGFCAVCRRAIERMIDHCAR
ncbi:MAG: peptidase M64 [Planctomycetes bacterium]|nr:peptidase M64 [Planctomycetota bacterium]